MTSSAIDWRDKAVWPWREVGMRGASSETVEALDEHSLFDGSFSWPAMILREAALDANLATMADFCRRHGLDFAPHGKTSMAPALFQRQIDAGAWGITVATAQQVRVAFGHGVKRVLLANQLLDATALDEIARLLGEDASREFLCLVDSREGVRALSAAAARNPAFEGRFAALVDVGWTGGRTGVRSLTEALELARYVTQSQGVRLAGISSYEGGLGTPERVREYFARVRETAEALADSVEGHSVVTAGGSAFFDLVAAELARDWAEQLGAQVILRSGAYASHDDGVYVGKTGFIRSPDEGQLVAAIEVWAQVISAPEPGLAIVGMGKRDAPYDEGMPIPTGLRREGSAEIIDIRGRASVPGMDDQHGYLTLEDGLEVRPGDLMRFGISHPCTAFDKWRVVPILDADDRVVELLNCYF